MESVSNAIDDISASPKRNNTSKSKRMRPQRAANSSTSKRSNSPPRNPYRGMRISIITLLLLGAGISGAAAGVFATIRAWTDGGAGQDTNLEWVEQEARGCLKGKVVVVTGANQVRS